jgi:hypothetical protein
MAGMRKERTRAVPHITLNRLLKCSSTFAALTLSHW